MTRGLNSPRGAAWFAKIEIDGVSIDAPASTYLQLESGLALSGQTAFATQNSTGVKLASGLALSGKTDYATQNSTGVKLATGLALSGKTNYVTQNSTAIVLPIGVTISNARTFTANSTAFIGTAEATLPTTDNGAAFTLISNSTGVALAVNTTGTTWKYLNVTSTQPT